ncbi:28.5L [Yaba monkey tumor virus]|uniref:28.5L n=1 Tax=Yaba monkey tumor virus (strain VR587) TaxID=928314 RepID=Q6TUY4_YMTV5|nr:hypothetical protein YMTVg28.5L [Yaba monkey tumor virus]AAR07385.1 28.5L [Yaba monkey tumor virus]
MQFENTLLVIAIIMMLLGVASMIVDTVIFINSYFVKKRKCINKNDETKPLLNKTMYEK